MKWYLAALCCFSAAAAEGPHLSYSKSFPGSVPAFVSITLDESGAGVYQEGEKDDNPVRFQLASPETAEIFGLVEKLGYFDHPLESGLKVAFMGAKTFRFENGAVQHEVKFNFSEDPQARLLAEWFDRITESEEHLINLEIAAKYDKLGVMKAVLLLESSYDHKRLVSPHQFLPLLDRIAQNDTYLHQARLRAANLADEIRAVK